MIGEKINATGMTGFVNEERTRSQWGQWRRERVHTCLSARCINASVRSVVYLCLSAYIWVRAFAFSQQPCQGLRLPFPDSPRLSEGARGSDWWSHHVVDEVFQPSHSENDEQRDDGNVPGNGWDGRDTLECRWKHGYTEKEKKQSHTYCINQTHTKQILKVDLCKKEYTQQA